MIESRQAILTVQGLETGYGRKQVIYGVSLEVPTGQVVALIGPNGSGKSTVLKAVCGLLPTWVGTTCFDGTSLRVASPAHNVARGISFAPQGNRVFGELSVGENLKVGGALLPAQELRSRIEETLVLFPTLRDRLRQVAGRLSGGEQQMLALARALIPKPRLLMLDEPSLGLSPGLMKDVLEKVTKVNRDLGVSILIVEQKVREVLRICHRVYSLKLGRVAFEGAPTELTDNTQKLKELFL